jgi:Tfp pilus assembly protein PilO
MKLILPIIIIALCVGMYFLYISPTALEIKSLAVKKAEYDNVLEKAREIKAKRDAVLADYNSITEDEITRLNKIVPSNFDSVLFVNDLNAAAGKYGMVVQDYKTNEPEANNREGITEPTSEVYRTTTVTFKLVGPYSQFIKFLNDIESSLRLIDLTSLAVAPIKDKNPRVDSLEYVLEVKTYSLR